MVLALDGSSDGGSYIRLYDGDSHYGQLDMNDISADTTYYFDTGGTLAVIDAAQTFSAIQTFSAGLLTTASTTLGANATTTGTHRFETIRVGESARNNSFPYAPIGKLAVNDTSAKVGISTYGYAVNDENNGYGFQSYAYTKDTGYAYAVYGQANVDNTADTGIAMGVYGTSQATHAGGNNIGVYGKADNGLANYSFWGDEGIMYNEDALAIATTTPWAGYMLAVVGDSYLEGNVVVTDGLEIPNGASPTVDAIGEIALDQTSNFLLIATSTNASYPAVIRTTERLYSFNVASTTLDWNITSPLTVLPPEIDGFTITGVMCQTDVAGTRVDLIISDSGSTNDVGTVGCGSNRPTSATSTSQNTVFTAGEHIQAEYANKEGVINNLSVSIFGTWTRD